MSCDFMLKLAEALAPCQPVSTGLDLPLSAARLLPA